MQNRPHRIRIGPAGWSYKDWEGIVYPAGRGSRFDQLAFIASYFDLVEVNSSFYRTPPSTHAASWLRRTASNPNFCFTAKLAKSFTHADQYPSRSETEAFRRFLDPLQRNDRLGALLIQFPWSFRMGEDALHRLSRILSDFRDYTKVVEVRHSSFQTGEFLNFLEAHDASLANIDQPIIGDSLPPTDLTTGPVGYARLHGRNYQKWFEHDQAWERYDYLYSMEELEPWVRRIETMSLSRDVFVVTNNHFRGQAILNAAELKTALGIPSALPRDLSKVYGEARIAAAVNES